jgi:hypothetical protein
MPVKKLLFRVMGVLCFGLGTIGIFVPLLPTVPLWILAAILFAGSSPRMQQRIYDHPMFGETVYDFVEHGVLTRKNKIYAIIGSGSGIAISLLIVRPALGVAAAILLFMFAIELWLATRPESVDSGD